MITLITGENDFAVREAVSQLVAEFDGDPEKIDGAEVELAALPDLLMGTSLFSAQRLVIIDQLSASSVWVHLEDWVENVSDDVHLVLVEPKPDKRTRTYKALQKRATIKDFPAWTNKDQSKAVEWLMREAENRGLKLTRTQASRIVRRTGVNQWQIHQAIEKLLLTDEVTNAHIDELIEANPDENVFALLETALAGDASELQRMLVVLRQTEDPYRVFGLLSSQILQLSTLALTDKSSSVVARDIKAAPFVLAKLAPHARRMSRSSVKRIINAAAESDRTMKSSSIDPWVAVERLLLKIALH